MRDKETGKSKGYAFILFEKDSGARAAYKENNGLKIKDRAIITDIERSRTIKSWVPRRLGGGLGGRHYTQRLRSSKIAPARRFDGPSSSSRGRGGSRFGSRGGYESRPPRGGAYERSRYNDSRGPPRSSYSSYDSKSNYEPKPRYSSRSERPERPERSERSDRYEYSSRSRREDRDYGDRDRDRDRDSRVVSEREKEREKYRERKLEQNRDKLRY